MESNKLFAAKAQLSTENMEIMTRDMHEIAQKTKQETVSMRIITLVTLFFLPGTFISVSICTSIVICNDIDFQSDDYEYGHCTIPSDSGWKVARSVPTRCTAVVFGHYPTNDVTYLWFLVWRLFLGGSERES
jgi:hypothetical protein